MPLKEKTFRLPGSPALHLTVRQLPAMRGFELFFQHIGRIMGPSLLQAVQLRGDNDITGLGPILDGFLARLSSEPVGAIARELLSNATVRAEASSGEPVLLASQEQIDGVFNGRMLNLVMAIRYAVEVNFADFLSGLGAMIGQGSLAPPSGPDNQPQEESGSQSISNTLGHSGDSGQPGAYS